MVHLTGYTARPPHPRVVRSAQGAEQLVDWKGWPDARSALDGLRDQGFTLVGLEPSAHARDFRTFHYEWPLCLVVGNEALGIAPPVARRLDDMVRIPMHGGKGSLNVVVALGVVLFHIASHTGRPARKPKIPVDRDVRKLLDHIVHRAAAMPETKAVWRTVGSDPVETPRLILLVYAPSMIPCRVWGRPDLDGVLLTVSEPADMTSAPRASSGIWVRVDEVGPTRRGFPLDTPMPHGSLRATVFGLEMSLSQARAAPLHLQRLALDAFVYDLLQTVEFSGRLAPIMTRFLGADDTEELFVLAETMVTEAARPWGGRWRERELLFEPSSAGRHDRTERFVRRILFGSADE